MSSATVLAAVEAAADVALSKRLNGRSRSPESQIALFMGMLAKGLATDYPDLAAKIADIGAPARVTSAEPA